MRYILHIIASLYIGGAEKVARDIALAADPQEYESHFVVFGDSVGEYEAALLLHGCKIFHIPFPSEGYRAYFHTLKDLMRQYAYQAVHAHTMFSIGWAMLAARQMGVPVRVAHAHSILDERTGLATKTYEALMRRCIVRNATHFVACADAAGRRLFGRSVYEKRGLRILNGIDTARFAFDCAKRQAMRKQLGLEDAFLIGHVGHFMAVKNQEFLIERMPQLLQRRENAVLLLLGDGETRARLEAKANSLGLQTQVIFMGNVTNVEEYLCAMDVFAFPSLYEGMPLSILEVQANGLPCVVSDRVPEDVFLTDLLTPLPLDRPSAWVDAICTKARCQPAHDSAILKDAGLDVTDVTRKYYDIYESNRK